MAKKFNIAQLRKKFADFDKLADQTISNIIQSSGDIIVDRAKRRVVVNNGQLRQSIGKEVTDDGKRVVVFASAPYAPYVEFGTGAKVQVPAELQDLAGEFKGPTGKRFDDMLKAIQDWCRNKGIDQKAAYPIALAILKRGQVAKPFLWPSFVEERDKVPQKIDKGLQTIAKDFNSKG